MIFFVFALLSCFCSVSGRVGFWITTPGMSDREKKKRTHHEGQEEEGDRGKSELASLMKYMMEENQKAEARREREAKMFEARLAASEEKAEKRRREDRIAEEERAEARRVAAEERAEERLEAKGLRKAAEAKRMEEREAAKEEAARAETERLRQEQEAINAKSYEQQVALMRLQSEIGNKAAEVHRVEQEALRKKERAISGIVGLREGEDVEEFLATSERKLKAGGVPEVEWVSVFAAKLGGKVGSTWQDLCSGGEEYAEVKAGLLRICGYTPKLAGELFYFFKSDAIRGLSADQLYNRGVQLVRRMVSPQRLGPETEFNLVKPWVWSLMPKQARMMIDSRTVTKAEELIGALQDYLVMEGERKEGQAAVFGRRSFDDVGSRTVTCFKCGKTGHKSYECEAVENGLSLPPASSGSSNVGSGFSSSNLKGVTCFTCGLEGHKSPQCPNRNHRVKAEPKEVPRMKRLKGHPNRDTFVEMEVNGQKVSVLLDSGSAITVVPSTMVAQAQLTGENVELRGFAAREVMILPLAEIPFATKNSRWKEVVALAPAGEEAEVVYGLDLKSTRGLELVYLANEFKLERVVACNVKKKEVREEVNEEVKRKWKRKRKRKRRRRKAKSTG